MSKNDNQLTVKRLVRYMFPDEFRDIQSIETKKVLVMNVNFSEGLETETIYHPAQAKTYEAFQEKFLNYELSVYGGNYNG